MEYDNIYHNFDWSRFCDEIFNWDWKKQFNITQAAVDRHVSDQERIAIYHVDQNLDINRIPYSELKTLTDKFASILRSIGLEKGDRVARLLPRIPETYVSFFGTWKSGMVDVPLYTAFGQDAIAYRIQDSGAKVLITDRANISKIESIYTSLKDVQIILVDSELDEPKKVDIPHSSYSDLMKDAEAESIKTNTTLNDPALLVYTSGTTGPPKGTLILQKGIISVLPYAKYCLDIQENEMYWGFADPGWTYGLMSAGSAVMMVGGSLVVFEPNFEPENWYKTIDLLGVTNFTAAPTAFRAIMAAGDALANKYKPQFRYLSSAGEPLNPEVIHWANRHFGVPIRDMYGITEVSMVLGNSPKIPFKPGSCGKPIPGFEVKLRTEDAEDCAEGETGTICVKQNDFFVSSTYWKLDNKYNSCFVDNGEWFHTGDQAYRDKEGYYFFVGREDDVISSSGYRIGPFEVESCLMEHPSVCECAVVGKPDELRGEIVKAFVVLNESFHPDEDLKRDITELCRRKLSKHNYPREIEFIEELPKTSSGKIQRIKLRK
jgi:acetyl-CoA synthetase